MPLWLTGPSFHPLLPFQTCVDSFCTPLCFLVFCFSPSHLFFTQSALTPPAAPSFSPSKVWASIMLALLFSVRSLPYFLMLSLLGLWQMQQKLVKEVSSVVHLDTMEAGSDYCVKAQTYVEAINRSSNFSQTQCVRAQGNSQPSFLFPGVVMSKKNTPAALPVVSTQYLLPCLQMCCPFVPWGS